MGPRTVFVSVMFYALPTFMENKYSKSNPTCNTTGGNLYEGVCVITRFLKQDLASHGLPETGCTQDQLSQAHVLCGQGTEWDACLSHTAQWPMTAQCVTNDRTVKRLFWRFTP